MPQRNEEAKAKEAIRHPLAWWKGGEEGALSNG